MTYWSHINQISMHLLMNAILSDSARAHYAPGDPKAGADRGWDGGFNGVVTFLPNFKAGRWMFQAKYTKKNFKPAVQHLKAAIHVELPKAVKAKVDYLVVFTSATLEPDQVEALSQLKAPRAASPRKRRGKSKAPHKIQIVVLARAAIEELLRDRPWLRRDFFGGPVDPIFVPLGHYRDPNASFGLAAPEFRGRDTEVETLLAKLGVPGTSVLLTGPGGCGKSRLLREVASRAAASSQELEVRFLDHNKLAIDCDEELRADRRYLLLVDDAEHETSTRIVPLANAVAKAPLRRNLIISGRSGIEKLVTDAIGAARLPVPEAIRIVLLSEARQREIVQAEVPGLDPSIVEEVLSAANGNLIVLGASLANLKGQPANATTRKALGHTLIALAEAQSRLALQSSGLSLGADFLSVLALATPIKRTDSMTLAQTIGSTAVSVDRAIDILLDCGILRSVGNTIRLGNDVVGDLILAERLSQPDGVRAFEEWRNHLEGEHASNIRRNLSEAGRLNLGSGPGTVMKVLLAAWRKQASASPRHDRLSILESAARFAPFAPSEALALVEALIATPAASHELDGLFDELADKGPGLTTDQVGPVLVRAGEAGEVSAALEILRSMAIPEGSYSDYKYAAIVDSWISPVSANTEAARLEIFSRLSTLLDAPVLSERDLALIGGAIAAGLARSFEGRRDSNEAISFWSLSPDWGAYGTTREAAADLLRKGLRHAATQVRWTATTWLRDAWRSSHWRGTTSEPPTLESERRRFLEHVASVACDETDLRVLGQLEETVLWDWANVPAISATAAALLARWPRSLPYLAHRCSTAGFRFPISSSSRLEHAPLPPERWGWLVHENSTIAEETNALVARQILAQFTDAVRLYDFLGGLPDPEGTCPWLLEVIQMSDQLRSQVVKNGGLPSRLSEAWCRLLDQILDAVDTDRVDSIARRAANDSAPLSSHDAFRVLQRLWTSKGALEPQIIERSLVALATHPDTRVRRSVLDHVRVRFEPTRNFYELMALLIPQDPERGTMQTITDTLIEHFAGSRAELLEPLQDRLEQLWLHDPLKFAHTGGLLVAASSGAAPRLRAAIERAARAKGSGATWICLWAPLEGTPASVLAKDDAEIDEWISLAGKLSADDRDHILAFVARGSPGVAIRTIRSPSTPYWARRALLMGLPAGASAVDVAGLLELAENEAEAAGLLGAALYGPWPQGGSFLAGEDPPWLSQRRFKLVEITKHVGPDLPPRVRQLLQRAQDSVEAEVLAWRKSVEARKQGR